MPLYEDDSFEQNCARLAIQVQKAGAAVAAITDRAEEVDQVCFGEATNESLAELTRLKEELSATVEDVSSASDGGPKLAHLPAGVPKLPPQLRVTPAITELKRLLLSTDRFEMQKAAIGFFGMGGAYSREVPAKSCKVFAGSGPAQSIRNHSIGGMFVCRHR